VLPRIPAKTWLATKNPMLKLMNAVVRPANGPSTRMPNAPKKR
jgi:hypothetical protein